MNLEQLVEAAKAYHAATGHALLLMSEDESRVLFAVIGNRDKLQNMAMHATKDDEEAASKIADIFAPALAKAALGRIMADKQKPKSGMDIPN